MPRVPAERTETAFADYKPPYTPHQALVEANRCLYCSDAPCIQACPTSIEIPEFIRKIATNNLKGSAKTIFDSNILGMSCARVCPVEVLCVGKCVYNEMGVPPIQIGKLQRFATDHAFEQGWRFYEAGPDTGKHVALIGAGPASLACAHELRRFGHSCTIFEKRDVIGGLNVTGVAPYKMPADRGETEVEWILGIGGIDVRTGVEIGRDVTLADLEAKYDAVFVGAGLGADKFLKVPGEDLPGVFGAVDWIEQMKLGVVELANVRSAAVIGGGNTAMDAMRELLTLGVPSVTLVYRGDEAGMSGYAHEWDAAKKKMAKALWRTQPVAFEGTVRVERVRFDRLGADKRPIAGEQGTLDVDLVLMAIGQGKLGAMLSGLDGIDVRDGVIAVDADGRTGRAKWYAGGDAANGGKEVVNAAAEGKKAAHGIHAAIAP
jgi:dihydropyrimidine dehydrogenase (NAD+) subunit PreT